MMRTLQYRRGEPSSTRHRVDGHDFEDGEPPIPTTRFAKGTPWPQDDAPFLDEHEELDRESGPFDPAVTTRLPPVYREELQIEIGTRTLMGVGARAVRAVAKSGWVEARPASREPQATPAAPFPQVMPPSIDRPTSPRVIVASSVEPVQPSHLSAEELIEPAEILPPPRRVVREFSPAVRLSDAGLSDAGLSDAGLSDAGLSDAGRSAVGLSAVELSAAGRSNAGLSDAGLSAAGRSDAGISARMTLPADSPQAQLISALVSSPAPRAIAPVVDPAAVVTLETRGRGRRASSGVGYRVVGVALLAIAVAALAAYVTTMVFFAFSTSWAMPAVISPSDDKVVSLQSGLAAQQHQRDRLAAELDELARTIAAQPDPRSDVAQQASERRKVLEASIARQDEIIRGLEQSPYLRAIADRAQVALVPYDNLAPAAPGTKLLACRVAMVMCREVGRVTRVLPGEVAFKHPRREKLMRGQMIELELTEPDAAARDVLFLGAAPLGI